MLNIDDSELYKIELVFRIPKKVSEILVRFNTSIKHTDISTFMEYKDTIKIVIKGSILKSILSFCKLNQIDYILKSCKLYSISRLFTA